jgi:hypothetical protein
VSGDSTARDLTNGDSVQILISLNFDEISFIAPHYSDQIPTGPNNVIWKLEIGQKQINFLEVLANKLRKIV